jgi:hypothetical protein
MRVYDTLAAFGSGPDLIEQLIAAQHPAAAPDEVSYRTRDFLQ